MKHAHTHTRIRNIISQTCYVWCVCVCAHINAPLQIYKTHIYIYTYIHTYIYIYTYIYSHRFIHTFHSLLFHSTATAFISISIHHRPFVLPSLRTAPGGRCLGRAAADLGTSLRRGGLADAAADGSAASLAAGLGAQWGVFFGDG